jgi:hypothetical protein
MNKIRFAILWAGALVMAQVGTAPLVAHAGLPYQDRYESQPRRDLYGRGLTGTYQLDRARSDDPRRASDQVLRQLPVTDRARVSERLMNRLDPPDVLSLERAGMRVTIASSRAPELRFDADGRTRTEQTPSGRSLTTRASLMGDRLDVSTRGQTGVDFSVTFEPFEYGHSLRVTRQLFDDRLSRPVIVTSVYRKIADTPDWDVFSGVRDVGRPLPGSYGARPAVIIPDGATVVATLDRPINVRTIRRNDRVALTVRSAPSSDLQDAVIEGTVINLPPATNGRTGLTIDFDQIRLRDGRIGDFDGWIEAIRGPNGEPVTYNGEQVRPNSDQAGEAVERGAIGAALGAVIGAVAGGSKGAAIGALIGGGGAAATVFVDPVNQSGLPLGTEFTIRTRTHRR